MTTPAARPMSDQTVSPSPRSTPAPDQHARDRGREQPDHDAAPEDAREHGEGGGDDVADDTEARSRDHHRRLTAPLAGESSEAERQERERDTRERGDDRLAQAHAERELDGAQRNAEDRGVGREPQPEQACGPSGALIERPWARVRAPRPRRPAGSRVRARSSRPRPGRGAGSRSVRTVGRPERRSPRC